MEKHNPSNRAFSILCTGILILSFGALSTNVGIGIVTDTFAQLSTDNELTPSGTIANPSPEEIQMDTNGDGIVDENESQNQPVPTGNNLPLGPKTGAQTFGGGTPQAKACEGDLLLNFLKRERHWK